MKKLISLVAMTGLLFVAASAALAEDAPAAPAAPAAAEGPKYGNRVGDVAQPIDLKTLDGKEYNTGKAGKTVVYVFVNSACGLCARQMNDMGKNAESFKGANVTLVAVDQTLDRFGKKYEAPLRIFSGVHDPDFKFGETVGLFSTPSTLVLDKDGKILFKESGFKPNTLNDVLKVL